MHAKENGEEFPWGNSDSLVSNFCQKLLKEFKQEYQIDPPKLLPFFNIQLSGTSYRNQVIAKKIIDTLTTPKFSSYEDLGKFLDTQYNNAGSERLQIAIRSLAGNTSQQAGLPLKQISPAIYQSTTAQRTYNESSLGPN